MKRRETIFTSCFRTSTYNYVLMILAALLLSSCWGIDRLLYGDYSIKRLEYDKQYRDLLEEITIEIKPEQGFVNKKCWDGSPLNDGEKAHCAYQRNLLIGDLIAISDGMCEKHMKTILGNDATMNIITGTLTNAFSGGATVVTGAGVKTILSALAFFSNSERSLINETVYKSVVVPAVIKKINELRLNERNTIIKKYEDKRNADYKDYPVTFALADIIKYHQSCSFMLGLQKALEEGTQTAVGQDKPSLEQKLKSLAHEKDSRIRELKAVNAKITNEEINKDKYIIYLGGEMDAITKKLSEPEAKKPEAKDTPKTVFEKLAEKYSELEEAKKESEKRKTELIEAVNGLAEKEKELKKAKEEVGKTEDAVNRATTDEKVKLNQLLEQLKAGLPKAEDEYKKASDKKKDLDDAVRPAESRVAKLQEEFNKLKKEATVAEKDRELQEARKDYEKRTAELTEAESRLTERENEKKKAQEDVDTTKNALNKAMQATDVAKQNELKQQLERYTAALKEATKNFDKASMNKGDAVNAKNNADNRVKKLKEDLDKLKKEVAETKS
jgi:chromosome segregation ATPase